MATNEMTYTPRVLVVGAYERDNFGDLLFWLVTSAYLRDAELHAAAPFAADMTELLGRKVEAYGPLLRDETFDVIWTAGGQVGRMDLRTAFRLSTPPEVYRDYRERSSDERARLLRDLAGGGRVLSPYIPTPLSYARNAGAIAVLNSVGLDGIRTVEPGRRAELVTLLRGEDFISVRDQASSDLLSDLGIEHRLVPDAVHAISKLRPATRDTDADTVIIQASSAHLGKYGHVELADAIVASPQLAGRRLRFLLAGSAAGHDSVTDYEEVIKHLRRAAPGTDVAVLLERKPYELADHIRRARLVIATSLHVRVVACSYGVPRVSFARPKPTKYARTWDPDMPFEVAFDELDTAVKQALAAGDDPRVAARSAELTQLAHDNLEDLANRVLAMARSETATDREQRQRSRLQHQAALAANEAVTSRDAKIAELSRELSRTRRELKALKGSRSYRLAARAARLGRAIRRAQPRSGARR